jgi:hypothetical protein
MDHRDGTSHTSRWRAFVFIVNQMPTAAKMNGRTSGPSHVAVPNAMAVTDTISSSVRSLN